jgi:membrane fusion protein, heavy metal efflux system
MKTPHPLQKNLLVAALMAAFALSGCSDKKPATGGHDHGAVASAADHHDEGGEKLTDFSASTELFVEYKPLVAGQAADFTVRLTRLADYKPLAKGKVTIVLAGGPSADEIFLIDSPMAPGVFKPAITPKASGERELTIHVESDLGSQTHELGPVTVFADAKAAEAAHGGHDHGAEGIPFGKEQQWKIDFATAEAIKGLARSSVMATASIKALPDGEAQLAAPAAGIVRAASTFPRVGQAVRKGQVLAMLAPRLGGETDQASLDASASKAKIGLEQARRERERMESLFKDEAIPEKRLLEARTTERVAQAELDAAHARAAQLSGGAGIAIRAPIDGTIADTAVTSGAFVAEGAPLFHIANTGRLWLETRVPESDIGRLGTPTSASFTVDGFDRTFNVDAKNGRLIAVGGVVDAATRTVPVIFEFANPANTLRLGMTAKAQLFAGPGKASVLIPASAVQDESGTQAVYVQTGGDRFERKVVQTGARDGDLVAILSGLEPGQRVVSRGAYLIRLSTSKSGPSGHAH